MAGPNSRHPYGSAPQSRINAVPETADGEADTANLPDPSATFRQQARLRLNALKVGSTADDRSGANISRGYVPGVGRISAHDTMNPAARAADWESAFGNSRTIMGARPVTWEQRRASDAAHDAAVTDSRLPDGHRPVIRYDSAAGGGTAQPPPPVTPQPAGQPSAAPSFNFPTPSISFDRHTAPPIQVPPPDPAGAHGGWGMPAADPTGANGGWGIPSATAMPGAAAGAMPGNVPEGYHDGVHGIVNTYNGMAARNVNGAGDAAQRKQQFHLMNEDMLVTHMRDKRTQGQDFNHLPEDTQNRLLYSYSSNAGAIPAAWNETARAASGNPDIGIPKGPEGMQETQSIGPDGQVTRHYNKPEPKQFDAFTTPQEVESKMDPNELSFARQIANHDLPQTAMSRITQDAKLRILSAVQVLNPNWKAADFPVQQAARKEFTTGSAAKNITSINTAVDHLEGVLQAGEKLKNTDYKPINYIGNWFNDNTDHPEITAFHTKAGAVGEELAKVYKGGVASAGEIEEQQKIFSSSLGPKQLKAAVLASVELMAGRITALRNQYESAYGKPRETPIIDERAQATLRKLGFDPALIDPAIPPSSEPPGRPAPLPVPTLHGAKPAKPAKPAKVIQNGVTYTLQPDGITYK